MFIAILEDVACYRNGSFKVSGGIGDIDK